ncbi:MAG: phosphoribosylformylglycinamidine cyclo-ligase [Vampirovibrionales bacterium]
MLSSLSTDTAAAYRAAGVDLDRADAVVDIAKRHAASTRQAFAQSDIGTFSGAFAIPEGYQHPLILAATDGVGTKLAIAQALEKHDTIGIDLVAMCVNDLLVQGGETLAFLDYIALDKIDLPAFDAILGGVAEGCRQTGCVLLGGETAEMPGFYPKGKYDVAGFAVGVVEKSDVYPRLETMTEGDVVIGLESTGVHSNGFSLVRHLMQQHHLSFQDIIPAVNTSAAIGEILLEPTRIYVKPILALLNALKGTDALRAMCHITGGGLLDNLPRVLPPHLGIEIEWQSVTQTWDTLPIYRWLQTLGSLDAGTMAHTFNSGIGYTLVVKKESLAQVLLTLETVMPASWGVPRCIGTVVKRETPTTAQVVLT